MIDFSKVYNAVNKIAENGKFGVGKNTQLYEQIAEEGRRLVDEAYEQKNFIDRTFNLADSYGSCLFVNGEEYPNSRYYLHRIGKANVPYDYAGEEIRGREAVERFFNSFDKSKSKGKILLVVVAAAPYARVLESGISYGLKHNYKVLAGISSRLEGLKRFYGGKVDTMIGDAFV